ncbi:MAG: FAD:protein FMN transferase [Ruminococcaceae bacterium]|nr:FAD:protein FMN transferase [Oscillospiraceae bacterium]
MRKFTVIFLSLILLFCSACNGKVYKNTETFFMMDTVVSISADCNTHIIKEAYDLCLYYEKLFSRTIEGSDVYKINNSEAPITVNGETAELIKKGIYYGDLSGGKFDITLCPVSSLYDFNNKVLPEKEEILSALKKVDYKKITVNESSVLLLDGQIDLGAIAKGYITDKVVSFLKSKGVKRATVNMGGNVYTFGDKKSTIGIRKPFSDEIIATITAGEATFVTSGIYQRYIEKDGTVYHHIIDKETGFGVQNNLSSVTIIAKSSTDADALSTTCMLLGEKEGISLIEGIPDTEAVFILKDGSLKITSGLKINGTDIILK